MKKILFLIFAVLLGAEEMKITSKYFHYDMAKRISVFKDDVNATKGEDNILSDKLTVIFDKNKKPTEFIAVGNVRFKINLDQNVTYTGKSKKLIYLLKKGDIILFDGIIIKAQTHESVSGKKIILNRITKNAEVIGGKKKPVEIIMKVNE